MQLLLGPMQDKLKELEDNSVDSIVTDPPYGIDFMQKGWDAQVPSPEMWKEAIRVLKPGGHLLSFSSARTYHRMTCAIEDAGFEIRDQIMWVYGSGFPKSHNLGKAYDKKHKIEREIIGENPNHRKTEALYELGFQGGKGDGQITKGNGPLEGWGTALKPAHEPICVARKPISEKTVLANAEKWGVGGLNIDASRVPYPADNPMPKMNGGAQSFPMSYGKPEDNNGSTPGSELGRWPANFIHDGSQMVLDLFPDVKGGNWTNTEGARPFNNKGKATNATQLKSDNTTGSAARFFYVPKVSKKERNEGCEGNTHPTVKPITLMSYLIQMVTPAGGVVLDPFMGSGSTGCAAVSNGYDFVGIELEDHSYEVAKARIEHWKDKDG